MAKHIDQVGSKRCTSALIFWMIVSLGLLQKIQKNFEVEGVKGCSRASFVKPPIDQPKLGFSNGYVKRSGEAFDQI